MVPDPDGTRIAGAALKETPTSASPITSCRAAPDTRMLAPGSEVISARSRDGTPMSSP
jgi:hypothetical protein